ncbi:alpha-L-arabinofuranosidase C-terminal domain-containing protein [Aeoliella sp. SH292]|uniref:alpha-L-arabinofuranosidase C-terminal domain-containing protein n=1 Tax=Aeoliella sp. SH292 TaxID=3454464 RepID=UPI003F96CF78
MPGGMLVLRAVVATLFVSCLASASCSRGAEVKIDVNVDRPTVAISPVLYGLFFEDINYGADGGLYAELVQNRSFEYYPVDGWAQNSRQLHPLFAWSKVEREGGKAELAVKTDEPLNKKNTKYLELKLAGDGQAGVRNEGFGGIVVEKGAKYDFSVYAKRTEDHDAPLVVTLETKDGEVLGSATIDGISDQWTKYEKTITASDSAADTQLVLVTNGGGKLMLDMVSLFPQDTFKGRKNGMRKDLAQSLADLKPGFLRFPGGCIAHGQGLANAYRWKDTVGDVAERKPNWNLWGYHQTYGLGYFEYMQLCEDIGAEPLPVVPLGVACGFRQPFDFAPMEDLHEWIDDALDLIEFANGPVDSEWGALRAAMGHPEPFNLKYLCLGNEEHDTPEVRERFPLFVDAIRKQYPDIKLIGTSGLGPEIPLYDLMTRTNVYSSDEHYYMQPGWYLDNVRRFDAFDRAKPKVFVGEYASEDNRQFNAVAEAAYLTGIERNADIVDMACYAPLFAKYGSTQWTKADLIWFDNQQLVKTPNYYVQQLFSRNKGDVYLDNTVEMSERALSDEKYAGRVGIGTWRTGIEVESASLDGKPLDFSTWEVEQGDFVLKDGVYAQRDRNMEAAVSIAPESATGEKSVFKVRARKTGGNEGFLLVFGHGDNGNYWWNVGGWGNTEHALQRKGGQDRLAAKRGRIENNRWYDLRVELEPGRIRCYLDDELVHDYQPLAPEVVASPTFDKSTGELLLKIVNPGTEAVTAKVNLQGELSLGDEVQVTTLAGAPEAMNNRESQPIEPVESTMPATPTMSIELPPTSVQLLRVKVK